MIDTDRYEGHTEGPWVIRTSKVAGATRMMSFFIRHYTNTERGVSKLICSMQGIHEHNADAELIADAPLLLEEVKRLREIEQEWLVMWATLEELNIVADVRKNMTLHGFVFPTDEDMEGDEE